MTDYELYEPHIEKAASEYAENICREANLSKFTCPGVDYACRNMALRLLLDGIAKPDDILAFLNRNSGRYKGKYMDFWWNVNNKYRDYVLDNKIQK